MPRHVAAAGGELFVADTPEEVERLAREKHPDEMPHVRYKVLIPASSGRKTGAKF